MMELKCIALIFICVLLVGRVVAGDVTLTEGWEFRRAGEAVWKAVRVPHDWAIAGPFDAAAKSGDFGKLPWKWAESVWHE